MHGQRVGPNPLHESGTHQKGFWIQERVGGVGGEVHPRENENNLNLVKG